MSPQPPSIGEIDTAERADHVANFWRVGSGVGLARHERSGSRHEGLAQLFKQSKGNIIVECANQPFLRLGCMRRLLPLV